MLPAVVTCCCVLPVVRLVHILARSGHYQPTYICYHARGTISSHIYVLGTAIPLVVLKPFWLSPRHFHIPVISVYSTNKPMSTTLLARLRRRLLQPPPAAAVSSLSPLSPLPPVGRPTTAPTRISRAMIMSFKVT